MRCTLENVLVAKPPSHNDLIRSPKADLCPSLGGEMGYSTVFREHLQKEEVSTAS